MSEATDTAVQEGRSRTCASSLNFGLVGTGDIMRRGFIPALKQTPDTRIVAVLSSSHARAKALACEVGDAKPYHDIGEFFTRSGVHAVILATPDGAHEQQVLEAARAGVHVLCSKPMAPTRAACLRMAEAAAARNTVLAMSHPLRSHNAFKTIRTIVTAGELGKVRYVRALWTRLRRPADELWRMDSRQTQFWALGRHGAHLVDLARWFFGEPVDVCAKVSNPRQGGPNDELAILLLTFSNGLVFELAVSILFGGGNDLEIFGEDGTLRADDIFQYSDRMSPITVGSRTVVYSPNNPFVEQMGNFVAAIRTGEPLISPASDGVRSVEIMEQALFSAAANRAVSGIKRDIEA